MDTPFDCPMTPSLINLGAINPKNFTGSRGALSIKQLEVNRGLSIRFEIKTFPSVFAMIIMIIAYSKTNCPIDKNIVTIDFLDHYFILPSPIGRLFRLLRLTK